MLSSLVAVSAFLALGVAVPTPPGSLNLKAVTVEPLSTDTQSTPPEQMEAVLHLMPPSSVDQPTDAEKEQVLEHSLVSDHRLRKLKIDDMWELR